MLLLCILKTLSYPVNHGVTLKLWEALHTLLLLPCLTADRNQFQFSTPRLPYFLPVGKNIQFYYLTLFELK